MLIYIVGYMSPPPLWGVDSGNPLTTRARAHALAACTYIALPPHGELFGLYIKPYDAAQPEESNLNNTRLRREYEPVQRAAHAAFSHSPAAPFAKSEDNDVAERLSCSSDESLDHLSFLSLSLSL